jgi:hypothetical protein
MPVRRVLFRTPEERWKRHNTRKYASVSTWGDEAVRTDVTEAEKFALERTIRKNKTPV